MAAVATATVCTRSLTGRSVFKETAGRGVLVSKLKLRWQSQGRSQVVGLESDSGLGKMRAFLISWCIVAIEDPIIGWGITVLC